MRVDTIFKYHFTFEYWVPVAQVGSSITWGKQDERTGLLIPGGSTNSYLITEKSMDTPMQVRNVRDRSGNVVFMENDEPIPMHVVSVDPQLDPFSNVIAYRHRLNKDLPRDYNEFISRVISS